jgi:hypothetical protein
MDRDLLPCPYLRCWPVYSASRLTRSAPLMKRGKGTQLVS